MCVFCEVDIDDRIFETKHWFVIEDKYPVNPGHLLIVTKEHIPHLGHLTHPQWLDLFDALRRAQTYAWTVGGTTHSNIGINHGTVAGQTVDHFHVHVIPRYEGDVENPRGGIRNFKQPIVEY